MADSRRNAADGGLRAAVPSDGAEGTTAAQHSPNSSLGPTPRVGSGTSQYGGRPSPVISMMPLTGAAGTDATVAPWLPGKQQPGMAMPGMSAGGPGRIIMPPGFEERISELQNLLTDHSDTYQRHLNEQTDRASHTEKHLSEQVLQLTRDRDGLRLEVARLTAKCTVLGSRLLQTMKDGQQSLDSDLAVYCTAVECERRSFRRAALTLAELFGVHVPDQQQDITAEVDNGRRHPRGGSGLMPEPVSRTLDNALWALGSEAGPMPVQSMLKAIVHAATSRFYDLTADVQRLRQAVATQDATVSATLQSMLHPAAIYIMRATGDLPLSASTNENGGDTPPLGDGRLGSPTSRRSSGRHITAKLVPGGSDDSTSGTTPFVVRYSTGGGHPQRHSGGAMDTTTVATSYVLLLRKAMSLIKSAIMDLRAAQVHPQLLDRVMKLSHQRTAQDGFESDPSTSSAFQRAIELCSESNTEELMQARLMADGFRRKVATLQSQLQAAQSEYTQLLLDSYGTESDDRDGEAGAGEMPLSSPFDDQPGTKFELAKVHGSRVDSSAQSSSMPPPRRRRGNGDAEEEEEERHPHRRAYYPRGASKIGKALQQYLDKTSRSLDTSGGLVPTSTRPTTRNTPASAATRPTDERDLGAVVVVKPKGAEARRSSSATGAPRVSPAFFE